MNLVNSLMLLEKCNQLSINIDHIYNAWVGLIMKNPALHLAEICQHIHEVFNPWPAEVVVINVY